jgi:CubicO group peptidase (beta-lactamase class C family)
MHRLTSAFAFALGVLLPLSAVSSSAGAQRTEEFELFVERVTARALPPGGPGCAVGVTRRGGVVTIATGFADLERRVPLTPTSILEAGSVSKQFTAAAIVLLALEGKLTLDDDVRKHFPELPRYPQTITIRHLLTHTSGLRDWGAIAALEGWPRGTRAYTNAHVLDIAARQQSLNHAPGTAYSYTNTGYNLLALLVQRVSGQSFADFTRDRLFHPLGMTNTSWRDDHERVVQGRALAYNPAQGGFATAMPNEDAHGNGGLLTTVRDLLKWNDAMDRAALGRAFADSVVKRYVLANGRTIDYALGIEVVNYRGHASVRHSGSTGGYRAQLMRFPDDSVSIAVLCNAGNAGNAGAIATQIVDSVLALRPPPAINTPALAPFADTLQVQRYAGVWAHETRRTLVELTVQGRSLRNGNLALQPVGVNRFFGAGATIEFSNERTGRPTRMTVAIRDGEATPYVRVEPASATPAALAAFVGTYASNEVHGEPFRATVENNQLVLRQSPTARIALTPAYRDAFGGGGRMVWFTRDASGRVTTMHIGQDRAWDVNFRRIE